VSLPAQERSLNGRFAYEIIRIPPPHPFSAGVISSAK
jgi:hypothetical protein